MNPIKIFKAIITGVNPFAGIAATASEAIVREAMERYKPRPVDETRVVPVKSALKSKINWVAGLAVVYALADFFGHPVPPAIRETLDPALAAVVPVIVIILRTWFTKSAVK